MCIEFKYVRNSYSDSFFSFSFKKKLFTRYYYFLFPVPPTFRLTAQNLAKNLWLFMITSRITS